MKKNFILLFILALFVGCSTEYEILNSYDAIILTADSSVKLKGEIATFTVKDKEGADLTGEVVFYIDGEPIEGNTFSSEKTGNFQVTAKYYTIVSEPLLLNFHDGTGINFRKKMLIEDYTGVWCGYCPRVAYGVELVHNQTEDAVAVAIHRPSSNPADANYDPYNFDTQELENSLGADGYPKGFLNRTIQWKFPEPNNINQAIALTQGENPKLGLALSPVINNGTITLDVDVMFGKDFSNNLKLVVYVLENGLIYDQHNYTTYYEGKKLLKDFKHNHVLRACLTPILGESIANTNTTIGNTYTKTFKAPLPTVIADASKTEFVAFVIDENGTVVNVRNAKPGEVQQIQLL